MSQGPTDYLAKDRSPTDLAGYCDDLVCSIALLVHRIDGPSAAERVFALNPLATRSDSFLDVADVCEKTSKLLELLAADAKHPGIQEQLRLTAQRIDAITVHAVGGIIERGG